MIFTKERLAGLKPTGSLIPRRSLSSRAANIRALETKKSIKTQAFIEQAKKRRSQSLGPDARMLIEKLHDDMASAEKKNGQVMTKGQ